MGYHPPVRGKLLRGLLGVALATLAVCGCGGGGEAVVIVTVGGRAMVKDVSVLLVDIQHGEEVVSADLSLATGDQLPKTFTITPNDRTGTLDIRISALDNGQIETARGAATAIIPTNGQTTVELMLEPTDRVLNSMIASAQTFTVTASHTGRQLARGADGNLIAVWENFCPSSRCDVLARRFDVDLAPLENATSLNDGDFLVNQVPEFTTTPAITAGPAGYAVAWRTTDDVKVALVGADGGHPGVDVAVTTGTTFEGVPLVLPRPGGFWAAWEQGRADGSREIHARRIGADGAVVGAGQIVSPAVGTHGGVHGATLASGATAIVWTRVNGADTSIVARVYGDDGVAATAEVELVAEVAGVAPGGPAVVAIADGFGVIYRQGTDLFGQLFDAEGVAIGGVLPMSAAAVAANAVPAVALRDDATLGVAWHACDDTAGNQGCDVHVRLYDGGTLSPRGPDRVVNTTRAGDQTGPSIVAIDGGFVVAWTDTSARPPDPDDDAIRGIVVYDDAAGQTE